MTDTDMLYMASLEKRNAELEARVAELEKSDEIQLQRIEAEQAKIGERFKSLQSDISRIEKALKEFKTVTFMIEENLCISLLNTHRHVLNGFCKEIEDVYDNVEKCKMMIERSEQND